MDDLLAFIIAFFFAACLVTFGALIFAAMAALFVIGGVLVGVGRLYFCIKERKTEDSNPKRASAPTG